MRGLLFGDPLTQDDWRQRTDGILLKRMMLRSRILIGVVIVTFLLTRALPGDPAAYFAGPAATKEAVEQIRVKLGLDKPLIEQFVRNYVTDLRTATSAIRSPPVSRSAKEIKSRLPASAELTLLGLLIVSMLIAVPLGIAGGDAARLADRPRLPRTLDGGRLVAGVLHRPDPRLCLLLSTRLGPGAARAARCVHQSHRRRSPASI